MLKYFCNFISHPISSKLLQLSILANFIILDNGVRKIPRRRFIPLFFTCLRISSYVHQKRKEKKKKKLTKQITCMNLLYIQRYRCSVDTADARIMTIQEVNISYYFLKESYWIGIKLIVWRQWWLISETNNRINSHSAGERRVSDKLWWNWQHSKCCLGP